MPVTRHARTSTPRSSTGRRTGSRAVVGLATTMLLGGSVVVGAGPASAVEEAESNAEARFLSGSVLRGVDLDRVANLAGVKVANVGLDTSVVQTGSVSLTALDTIRVPLEGGITVPLGDFLVLGAANQYGEAAPEGVSRSAAGAVTDTGVVNTAGGGRFPSDATLSLTPLLAGAGVNQVVTDLDVRLRAISAVAGLDAAKERRISSTCEDLADPKHCRDYYIAGGDLSLTAPALAALGTALTSPTGVAATVDQAVNSLAGDDGSLAQALGGVSDALDPLLEGDGIHVAVTSRVENSLDGIVKRPLTDGVVTIDLATGRISADLEKLLGVQLHDLPPNTELLTPDLVSALAARVAGLLRALPAQVETALTNALNAATVSVSGSVCVLGTGPDCTVTGVLDPVTGLPLDVPELADVVGGDGVLDLEELIDLEDMLGILDAPLGDNPLTDGLLGAAAVAEGVRLSIGVDGSVAEVRDGTADVAVTLETAGEQTTLDLDDELLDALAGPIEATLFADTGAVDTAVTALTTAITRALTALAPTLGPISDLASLRVNVQEDGPVAGSFREVALRITLGELVGPGGLATIDLARAQVGPNALPVEAEEPPAEEPPAQEPPSGEPTVEEPPATEPPTASPDDKTDEDISLLPATGAPPTMPLILLSAMMLVAGTGLVLAGRRTALA